jgi:hypothetical protein
MGFESRRLFRRLELGSNAPFSFGRYRKELPP